MMPTPEPDFTLSVPTTVPAVLMVVPEVGEPRPATAEDLAALGWANRDALYHRAIDRMEAASVDPTEDGPASVVRYFIEYVVLYTHDQDPEDLIRFRRVIEAARATYDDEVADDAES